MKGTPLQPNRADIERTLSMLVDRGATFELRALGRDRGRDAIWSGYFVDIDRATTVICRDARAMSAVYVTLNPVRSDLRARRADRIELITGKGTLTGDGDIVRRRRLLIDVDPERPSGISSTDDEHAAAIALASEITDELRRRGWPEPLRGDSGNGGHLVYAIDLLPDDHGLVQRVLEALQARFGRSVGAVTLKIDTTVANPARITKLFGTWTCKGDDMPDRPHRLSGIIDSPEHLEVVSHEQLEAVVTDFLPPTSTSSSGNGGASSSRRNDLESSGQRFEVRSWLTNAGLVVHSESPWVGRNGHGTVYVLEVCPFNADHSRGEACVIQFDNGAISAKCHHDSCKWGWAELRKKHESVDDDAPRSSRRKKTPTQLALEIFDESLDGDCSLFHDPDRSAYTTIRVADHTETWPIEHRELRRFVQRGYFGRTRSALAESALKDVCATLSARALFDGPELPVATRVAEHEGAIYLDLADENWRVVEVTRDGWRLTTSAPVRFRRTNGMRPLPVPIRGGSVDALRTLITVKEHDYPLVLTFLVAALHPTGPYPILMLHGEAGAAKTTQATFLRSVVDPNKAPLRLIPKTDEELMIAAKNSHVLGLDNISRIPPWLSDTLCSIATGVGLGKRELYTDGDEVIFSACKPIIVNGINDLATAEDLASRSITITLPKIEKHRDDVVVQHEQDAARPEILGVLLDGLCASLRGARDVDLAGSARDRLITTMRRAVAAEVALGLKPSSVVRAYERMRHGSDETVLEASPIYAPLCAVIARCPQGWSGIAQELLTALEREAVRAAAAESRVTGSPSKVATFRKDWPRSPRGLSGMLRRLSPALRRVGIEVVPPSDESRGSESDRPRIWRIGSAAGVLGRAAPSIKLKPSESNPPQLKMLGDQRGPDDPDGERVLGTTPNVSADAMPDAASDTDVPF